MNQDTFRNLGYKLLAFIIPIIICIVCLLIFVIDYFVGSIQVIQLCDTKTLKNVYIDSGISSNLSSCFFTIGALLLTLQVFIISTLQQNIYDNLEYQEKSIDKKSFYFPLQRITEIFLITTISSILVAFLNFMLKIFYCDIYILFCIALSVTAFYYILLSVYLYTLSMYELIAVYKNKNDTLNNK